MALIIDTHAHYDDEVFDQDREQLFEAMKDKIEIVVNVGASMKSCQDTLALMEKYSFVYGALGVHPSEVEPLTPADMEWIKKESSKEKIVAIGEIGLDYHWKEPAKEVQYKWFIEQLKLAREVSLPIIIHSRDAAQDTLSILKQEKASQLGGIIHCYSYSKETAKEFLDMGFYFGIGGVVTFANGKKLKEVVEYLPLDKIVLETDCPYLSPERNRGKRNSSLNLPYVVDAIAAIKGISKEEVIEVTQQNAKDVYRIK